MTIALLRSIARTAKRRQMPSWTPDFVSRTFRDIVSRSHQRYHALRMEKAIRGESFNLDDIVDFLKQNAVAITAPCVLISQAQRSGGSLLSQLFDGHPALAAYPMELRFGFADQETWPELAESDGADAHFRALFDLKLARQIRKGYLKGGTKIYSAESDSFVDRKVGGQRFFYVPAVHYAVFRHLVGRDNRNDARTIFNAYFSAFFNSWLDYQGRLRDKQKIVAFQPRLAHRESNVSGFFGCYPDGKLIQLVRDPRTWYVSAKSHRATLLAGEKGELLGLWQESARSILRNRERYGDRIVVVTFEQLVGDTEPTMRKLSEALGIAFDPVLLTPTFNGNPMRANSSFANERTGLIDAPLKRASELAEDERSAIEQTCAPLYDALKRQSLGAVLG